MTSFPILTALIIVPLVGAFIACFINGEEKSISKNLRELAVWISLVELILSIILVFQFDFKNGTFQFIEKLIILSKFNISYHLGVDAISIMFILLTTSLFPICFCIQGFLLNLELENLLLRCLF